MNDSLRIVAVVLYALNLMAAVWVMLVHRDAYRRQPDPRLRLLPHHVYVIAASYAFYGGGAAAWSVDRIDHPFAPDIPLGLLAGTIGLYGMSLVLKFLQTRQ